MHGRPQAPGARRARIGSRVAGSSRAETSPGSRPRYAARATRRRIFPFRVLGRRRNEVHGRRPERLAQPLDDVSADGRPQRPVAVQLGAGARHDEDDDPLALDLVRHAHRERLDHDRMGHRRRLHLGRTDPLARHLDRVVRPAGDVPEAVVVDPRPVAMDPGPRQAAPVRFEIPIRVAPEALGHPGPRLADDQLPHLAPQRVAVGVHHVGGHAGARAGERAGGDRRDRRAAHDPAADLGSARVVDDRRPLVRPPPGTATTTGRGSTAPRSSPAPGATRRSWARTGSAPWVMSARIAVGLTPRWVTRWRSARSHSRSGPGSRACPRR